MSKEVWGYHEHPKRREPDWVLNPQTNAVREGLARSGFGETSEALFLNSGFTYANSQEAVDSFTDETDHYLYSRFHNPTVAMFEKRLAAIEGAEHCVATGSGMSAILCHFISTNEKIQDSFRNPSLSNSLPPSKYMMSLLTAIE